MYKKNITEVLDELNTSNDGLDSKAVSNRQKQYGKNKIEKADERSKLKLLLNQFDNTMIKLLLIVSIISATYSLIMDEPFTDTVLIVLIVLLNVVMGYIQESRAEAEIKSLKKIEKLSCRVKRNGEIIVINSESLLPGDILYLEAGNKIPADGRIIECSNLKVNESLLTGESEVVLKNSERIDQDVLINDRKNMVYSGCDITNGRCICVVTDIGMSTELGKIAKTLTEKKDVPTPLQIKINEISSNLTKIVLVVIAFVFIYNIFILKNEVISVVMLAISLLVSAVPEGLPAVITVSLSVGVHTMAKKRTIVRTLSSVEALGNVEVICSDKTGTITQNKMTVTNIYKDGKLYDSNKYAYNENDLLLRGMMFCNDSNYTKNKLVGDPTETALISCCMKNGIDYSGLLFKVKRIGDIPFDSDRKMMSCLYNDSNKFIIYSKGSLESILKCCNRYFENGKVHKLDDDKKEEFFGIEKSLSKQALRVIAFAYNEDSKLNEDKLIFTGMVGMIDPPRTSVKGAIATCKEAGITPIMITGDNLTTAMEIAKRVGLADENSKGLEGKEIAKLSDFKLADVVSNYSVYARVSPNDKVRIVQALQKNKKIVAMTGDGVNDAPAIKLADIGIGMGKSGTEVTKSTADILLLDDCFSTIIDANYEGRRMFDNIRNVIIYSLSSNFAEIFIVLAGMFLGTVALLPIHILYIDLVTDAALSICLAFEGASKGIMKRKPRKSTSSFFTPFVIASLGFSAVIEGLLVLICFLMGRNYGVEVAQTMALLCLICQETLYAINCRNLKEPVIKQGLFTNKFLNVGLILIILIQVLTFISPIGELLHIEPLTMSQVLFVFALNIVLFFIMEISKVVITKFFKDE